jgi:small-conductance mechanosensitive channel
LLKEIATEAELALQDTEPVTNIQRFGDSGIDILFGVWANTEDYFALQTDLIIRIKDKFDAAGIEIPYPHVSLYAGSHSAPIQITNSNKEG